MPPVRQRGFVLIVTLWVLVVLGTLLTHLGYQVRVEAQIERRALNQSQLRWAARGAVNLAAAQVREHLNDDYHSPLDDWWSDPELYRDRPLGRASVSLLRPSALSGRPAFGLDDEESRLNINVARPEHLMGFAGVSSVLAEDIVLFRLRLEDQQRQQDEDENEGQAAVEEENNGERAGGDDGLVQGPIRSLRELLAVEGVTEQLLFEVHDGRPPLAELLTTVSNGKVNVNTAPGAVLTALGLTEEQLETVLARRQQDPPQPFTSADELGALFAGQEGSKRLERLRKILDVRSATFRLRARAVVPQQPQPYTVEATLAAAAESESESGSEFDSDAESGAKTLAFIRWQEY